jgi:uncharacterized membrane protein
METTSEGTTDQQVLEYLHGLERRIARIENYLSLETETREEDTTTVAKETDEEREEALEFRIGQYWFAKAGVLILGLGIAFFLTLPYTHLPPVLPSLAGYLLVAGVLLVARKWRDSLHEISQQLLGVGMVLLYVTTLRLHFFTSEPALGDKAPVLALLLIAVSVSFVLSLRRNSASLVGISATLGYLTALIGGQSLFVFAVVSIVSGAVVYIARTHGWKVLIAVGIILAYVTHALWLMNNPILGGAVGLISPSVYSMVVLLVYALIFALGTLYRGAGIEEDEWVGTQSFLNLAGCYSLFLFVSIARFGADLSFLHLIASLTFLALAVAFWLREKSRYSTFLYAMTGYAALSVAIVDQFNTPDYFVWLGWQSIIVVSTAVWFRSRFIIVANFVIYLAVFVAYLFIAGTLSAISMNFGLIALLSARILNWQKQRLELKTETMRNAYLGSAFFILPYALYHSVPEGYVSLSWLGVALFYYLISVALKNKKYRWMALLTLVLTIAYVIIVDLVKLEPTYRILSFVVLGVVLLMVSVVYTKKKLAGEAKGSTPEGSGP